MARFGRRFEVKNEMRDIKEIRPNDKQQTGGQSTIASQEDIKREANSIGFDDENIGVKDKEESLGEYRTANAQVESELAQCNILVDSVIEGFLDINEFNGVESYRQLAQTIEDAIMTISKMQGSKDKGKIEEASKKTVLDSLSEEETQKIVSAYRNMSSQGKLSANAYISSQAKKLGVNKKELTSFIQEKGKAEISSPNKVLHYHRTSMQSFEQIMQTGFLLNRKNMQLNGIDISRLNGSSSANVQFSRDIYNEEGELQSSGFDIDDNLGASSADVVFVMSPELMNEETYNCLAMYPTVEKTDIQRCCATILAKDINIQNQIQSILKAKNLQIRTMLQGEFDRESVLEELSRSDTSKQVEEKGAILHSVNGQPIREAKTGAILKSVNCRDILSSAIEATEGITRTSTINQEVQNIRSVQKDRMQQQDKTNNGTDR